MKTLTKKSPRIRANGHLYKIEAETEEASTLSARELKAVKECIKDGTCDGRGKYGNYCGLYVCFSWTFYNGLPPSINVSICSDMWSEPYKRFTLVNTIGERMRFQ